MYIHISYLFASDDVDPKTHISITACTEHLANTVVANGLGLLLILF